MENKSDVTTSSARNGTRRLSEDRDKKGKSSRKKAQRMRAKVVGLSDAKAARKRGDVEVGGAFRDFVLALTKFIDKEHSSAVASFKKSWSRRCKFVL